MYYVILEKKAAIIYIMDDYIMKDYFKEHSILNYMVLYKNKDVYECMKFVEEYTKG